MTLFYTMIQIWGCFFRVPFMRYWFFPLVALAFFVCVPRILRVLVSWR